MMLKTQWELVIKIQTVQLPVQLDHKLPYSYLTLSKGGIKGGSKGGILFERSLQWKP